MLDKNGCYDIVAYIIDMHLLELEDAFFSKKKKTGTMLPELYKFYTYMYIYCTGFFVLYTCAMWFAA